ncbi:hypothetical protein AAFF_G00117730 [Aldrovandia affinis]|uniref:Gypsy retrotransposon integrase-like protein 1 n=1 Tax=Aldrovandia affinis TaxID=143900 RepID=A0AAD7T3L8_9TELE|nr:hypothetical protein AAFF_G00117730 [Aldrovandia affinis]
MRESSFREWFGEGGTKLQDPSAWLALTAANGHNIPYIGCTELDLTIGSVTLEKCGIVVVKDHCLPRIPGLLGMNVIHRCWKILFQDGEAQRGGTQLEANPLGQRVWMQALKLCGQEARFAQPEGEVGYVCITTNVKILPKQEVLFTGRVRGGPGVNLSGANLSTREQQQVAECLPRHREVFSLDDQEYGKAMTVLHNIPTGDAPPIHERHRQIPPNLYQEVWALLQDMLEAGVIHQSCSPWATPVVLGVNLGSLEQRWAARLSNYHFDIQFRPGKANANADTLSRVPMEGGGPSEDEEEISVFAPVPTVSASVVKAFLVGVGSPFPEVHNSVQVNLGEVQLGMTPGEWKDAQQKDCKIRPVLLSLRTGKAPSATKRASLQSDTLRILRERKRLTLKEGVLYRQVREHNTANPILQLVLPAALKEKVWQCCHERAGHTGAEKTLALIRSRFFWPKQAQDVQAWCASCPRCILHKTPVATTQAPLVSITTTCPLELVAMDFLKLPLSTDGYQYVPRRFHSDQGANFESAVIQDLCNLYGTKKSRTTPYHPEGNGVCERFNRTLLSPLRTLEEGQKPRWTEYIAELVFMYNNTVHSSTGQTPSYLLFGWHPRLPLDVTLGTAPEQPPPQTNWVRTHHQKLSFAHQKAAEKLEVARQHQKKAHDRCPLSSPLLPGERVLLRQRGAKGGGAAMPEARPARPTNSATNAGTPASTITAPMQRIIGYPSDALTRVDQPSMPLGDAPLRRTGRATQGQSPARYQD